MVQLGGPNPRVGKMQMVLMTVPKLRAPSSMFVARKPCVQKVIRGIRKEPHRRICAGP